MVHAGLSVPLKPCQIEFALNQDKKNKIDYLPKIWFHAVNSAETDAMEEIPDLLGNGINKPELFQEIFTMMTPTANHISYHHVTTTSLENTAHAQLLPTPQLAKTLATKATRLITTAIKELPLMPTM